MSQPSLSIVVPVFNEQDNLEPLVEEIRRGLEGESYELILVDDGSTDTSFETMRSLAIRDSRIRCIRFRGNFGQTAAMSAGIDVSRGRVIVSMDADLQNDPADIPRLVARLDQGYDVVSGWRRNRKDHGARVLPSRVANWLISRISGVRLHDFGCTLKAYRGEILRQVKLYGEMHRFIPLYAALQGARIGELEVHHRPRRYGESKYGFNRIWKVLLDLMTAKILTSYVTKPIYAFGGVGMILCSLGVLTAGVALVQKLAQGTWVHRNPLALLAVFFFLVGMQLIMMGVLAELLIRIHHAVQDRPAYAIRETFEPEVDSTDADGERAAG